MTGPRHEYSRSFYRGVLAALLGAALSGLLAVVSPASAQTWTQTSAPSDYWWSVASSADGSKVVAACFSSGIYTSADYYTNLQYEAFIPRPEGTTFYRLMSQ